MGLVGVVRNGSRVVCLDIVEALLMTDLRALLYEPWGEGDFSPTTHKEPLATRMPEAVPAGMEWNYVGRCWRLLVVTGEHDYLATITNEQAELLFIGNAVKVMVDATDADKFVAISPASIGQFAAALHRLADERDGNAP